MVKRTPVHAYDRILRENFHDCNMGLMRHLLGTATVMPLPLSSKLHYTLEQEGDRFFLIDPGDGSGKFIANIEWQVKNDPDMPVRMLLYHALRYKADRIPVKGYVVYLGNEPLRMKNRLEHFQLQYSFEIIDLRKYDASFFLHSNRPEEVILAILTGYDSGEAKREIVKEILDRLQHLLPGQPRELNRRIRQLEVLGKLRGVQQIVLEEERNMATLYELYDLKTDIRYLQGKETGLKKGEKKGEKKGIAKERMRMVERMVADTDLSNSMIADLSGIAEVVVTAIRSRIAGS